ncbi:MAG: hypothetical protein RQ867_07930 [Mariprofundaceae bacterium]|nr:hypothetical protein [Mariprofundaceae bacterium]
MPIYLRPVLSLSILLLATSCSQDSGLTLSPEWQSGIITQWQDELPDMLVLSKDGKTLFISCEASANMLSPSLVRIDLETGKKETLLYGLDRADGLKMDQRGDLWLGEEVADGLIYRISSPEKIDAEQRLDRDRLVSSHAGITPVLSAGRFSHEGMAFSKDWQYLYLADEWKEGCLYRFEIKTKQLHVFHSSKGWLHINTPEDSRFKAEVLHGKYFDRLEDMELLPDGRVLMAETGSGQIWVLDDRGTTPKLAPYLKHPEIQYPDNLEWDQKRQWLWITNDSSPSNLWAWDGKNMMQIASHRFAEITGVESAADGSVYFNLQHNSFDSDLTLNIKNRLRK